MNGVMGVANAERTMDYIRVITEFISQVRAHAFHSFLLVFATKIN